VEIKYWILTCGVLVTFVLGIANLIYNFRSSRRTAFVNAVTSERVKWIAKVRANFSTLMALTDKWMFNRPQDGAELMREIAQLKFEISLQLNPEDDRDMDLERLLDRLPNRHQSMTEEEFFILRDLIKRSSRELLKREWEKVKAESIHGNLIGESRPRPER
jgi:hypothetical protein